MKNKFGIVRVRYIDEEERYEYGLMPDTYSDMGSAERSVAYLGDEIGDMLIPVDLAYVSNVDKMSTNIWITTNHGLSRKARSLSTISVALRADIDHISWIYFWENGEADDMLEVALTAGFSKLNLAKTTYRILSEYLVFDDNNLNLANDAIRIASVAGKGYTLDSIRSIVGDMFCALNKLKGDHITKRTVACKSMEILRDILITICYSENRLTYTIEMAAYMLKDSAGMEITEARIMLGRKLSAILPLREVLLASVK